MPWFSHLNTAFLRIPDNTFASPSLDASVRDRGVLVPLLVVDACSATGPSYVVLAGRRRVAAARMHNVPSVPCLVYPRTTTIVERAQLSLIDNNVRSDSLSSDCASLTRLVDAFSPDALAAHLHISRDTIDDRIHLTRLIPALYTQIGGRHMAPGALLVLSYLPRDQQQRIVDELGDVASAYTVRNILRLTIDALSHAPSTREARQAHVATNNVPSDDPAETPVVPLALPDGDGNEAWELVVEALTRAEAMIPVAPDDQVDQFHREFVALRAQCARLITREAEALARAAAARDYVEVTVPVRRSVEPAPVTRARPRRRATTVADLITPTGPLSAEAAAHIRAQAALSLSGSARAQAERLAADIDPRLRELTERARRRAEGAV